MYLQTQSAFTTLMPEMRQDRAPLRRAQPAARPEAAAHAHLRFIRETMARTGTFTAVPGWGGAAMGATAIVAAYIAHQQPTVSLWLTVWAAEALVGFAIGAWATAIKARKSSAPVLSGQGRKFFLGLLPAVLAGVALTLAVYGFEVEPSSDYDPATDSRLQLASPCTCCPAYGCCATAQAWRRPGRSRFGSCP